MKCVAEVFPQFAMLNIGQHMLGMGTAKQSGAKPAAASSSGGGISNANTGASGGGGGGSSGTARSKAAG